MNKLDKKVLCIPSDKLFSIGPKWQGLQTTDLDKYFHLLNTESVFIKRADAEQDVNYKQIIPQVILKYNDGNKDLYFLHKQTKITDKRLSDMYPLFIGGHIEQVDGDVGDPNLINNATLRELQEEVKIDNKIISKDFKGIIYIEDDNFVNHVHIGLVWIWTLDGQNVKTIEDNLETVGFVDKEFLLQKENQLTYRSRLYLKYL